jgi:hypothetical protein
MALLLGLAVLQRIVFALAPRPAAQIPIRPSVRRHTRPRFGGAFLSARVIASAATHVLLHTMHTLPIAVLAFVATTAVAQSPQPQVWSEVTGQAVSHASKDRTGASIRRVDGRFVFEPIAKIAPGERDVVVQSPPRRGFGGTERHFRLRAEPCRRYYVNAQFRAATRTDWDPVVAKSEPIIGCRLPAG